MNTNTVTVNVIASPCGCPPGDVCPDSLGVCPSGYMPDPNNLGCCVPQCPEQSCNPGQKWSSSACQCLYIKANSISAPISYKSHIAYNLTFNAAGGLLAFGLLPEGTDSCVGWYGNTGAINNEGNDTVYTTKSYKFTVLDVNGNPIPNVPLTFSGDTIYGKYPIVTANITGEMAISVGTPGNTDANGNAEITLTITFTLTSAKDKANPYTVTQYSETAYISGGMNVQADNHGTGAVSGLLSFGLNFLFCENWGAVF